MSQSPLTESTPAPLRRAALLTAVALGALADWLDLFGKFEPALNFVLWVVVAAIAAVVLLARRPQRPATESLVALAVSVALAATFAWRDTESVLAFSLFGAIALSGIAAGHAGTAWLASSSVGTLIANAVRVITNGMLGPLPWGIAGIQSPSPAHGWRKILRIVLLGGAMALPVLLVVGTMLRSADPVFNAWMAELLWFDLYLLVSHLFTIGFVAWGVAGYLGSLLTRQGLDRSGSMPQPGVGVPEIAVALWLVNALFIAFLVVQIRYLFGGATLVEVTAGLSYAEYARRGFFELVMAAALVIPVLLLADWAAAPTTGRQRTLLRGTMLLLLLLLGGVLASAAYRMHVYQQVYGLTEPRIFVTVALLWVGGVLCWLAFTVLRGARERFVAGSVWLGVACIAGLIVLDPHALIARVNLDRAQAGEPYDGSYLAGLSAEAVPVLLERLRHLAPTEQCHLGNALVERWGQPRIGGWRAWNAGDARARQLVQAQAATLTCRLGPVVGG